MREEYMKMDEKLIKKDQIDIEVVWGCDLAGIRTQDPLLKREMLYQLSYQVNKNWRKISLFAKPSLILRLQT